MDAAIEHQEVAGQRPALPSVPRNAHPEPPSQTIDEHRQFAQIQQQPGNARRT